MKGMVASLEIKHGVVQDLRVELGSMDHQIEHSGIVHISGEYSQATYDNRTPWSIRKLEGVITGGNGCRTTSQLIVEAWPSAPRNQLLRAFDFDITCLWLGVRCSRCQLLPSACEGYTHGDWYEFVMSKEALGKFRQAVNCLKLGTPEDDIYGQLGGGDPLGYRRLRDLATDRVPYDFPSFAIREFDSPPRLTYYVKKWRLHLDAPKGPDDQGVTFVLDDHRRLQRIESQVEGIPSRP